MNRYKNPLITAAVLSVLAVIGTIMNSRQASADDGGPKVTIVSPIPLPVRVDNEVSDPVRVRNVNDAIQPFQVHGSCNGTVFCEAFDIFKVPVGKRAVIEYFSGIASIGTGQVAAVALETLIRGGSLEFFFVPLTSPPGIPNLIQPGNNTTWGQQVRLYSDVSISGLGSASSGPVIFNFEVSGYLVDVPFTP
jgi:hypothetical protein